MKLLLFYHKKKIMKIMREIFSYEKYGHRIDETKEHRKMPFLNQNLMIMGIFAQLLQIKYMDVNIAYSTSIYHECSFYLSQLLRYLCWMPLAINAIKWMIYHFYLRKNGAGENEIWWHVKKMKRNFPCAERKI